MTGRRTMRFAAVAGGAVVAIALAGCGSDGGAEGSDASTTLVWNMWTGSTAEADAWMQIAEMVTEEYPEITLEFETSSFPDYWTKLAAQASGGDAACILGVQSLRAPSIEQLLLPLDDLIAASDVDLSEFNSSIIGALQLNGAQVALPYDFGPQVMFYNATRFQEVGVPEPTVGWTVEDFESAAKALTTDDTYGFALFPTLDTIEPWSRSMEGVAPVTDEGEIDLLQPGFVSTVEWYTGLVTEQQVAAPITATPPSLALDRFAAGDAAMVVDGPWQTINISGQADFEVGIAPMPAGDNGSVSQVAGSGFGISETCENPEAAMKAISVMTGPDALQYLAEQGRAYPARTAQQEVWFTAELTGVQEGLEAAITNSVTPQSTANYTQVSALFSQYAVEAVNGQRDATTFLESVQQRVP